MNQLASLCASFYLVKNNTENLKNIDTMDLEIHSDKNKLKLHEHVTVNVVGAQFYVCFNSTNEILSKTKV